MKEILFKLNEFCCNNRIEYVVTGTMALDILGVPSHGIPQDIDIKVFHLTDEQAEKLSELEFLSGLNKNEYKDKKCFAFLIDGVKINAIKDDADYDAINATCISVNFIDEKRAKHHLISVQRMRYALHDKVKLNREKDVRYMFDFISILTSIFGGPCLKK